MNKKRPVSSEYFVQNACHVFYPIYQIRITNHRTRYTVEHARTYYSYTLDDIDYGGFVIFTVTVSLEKEKKEKRKKG